MATDPITNIHIEEHDSGFSTNLNASLRELAQLEPSHDAPYLTVYLDWRPEGNNPGVRPARISLDNAIARLRETYEDNDVARESLETDFDRVKEFLEEDLEPAAHGVIIIACSAHDVFETFVLALPLETRITAGPTPALLQMARVVEDYPRYAVLVANQHETRLMVMNRASHRQSLSITGSDYPRKQKQGGWSQRRYQNRADERVSHFARAVAEETRRVLQDGKIEMLILSSSEVMRNALDDEFHESVKERIIGELHLDMRASEHDIVEASTPLVERAERKREFETVKALDDAVGSGSRGVAGIDEVLQALSRGQVWISVMASDFQCRGWADYTMNVYGVGDVPDAHPAGGDLKNIYPVDLEEEIVRLTIVTGAEGEIIPAGSGADMKNHGGVGAILRF